MTDSATTGVNFTFTVTYCACPYRNRCSDNGKKCDSCVHNPKRSYFEPIVPYVPYIPYSPSPYWPYWYTTSNNTVDNAFYQPV